MKLIFNSAMITVFFHKIYLLLQKCYMPDFACTVSVISNGELGTKKTLAPIKKRGLKHLQNYYYNKIERAISSIAGTKR
ncbi:hypothetical protein DET65_1341 [Sunxiuqinia elliptica]|uniref:Uncharacterized protein n=1 Tax=Sunxiuqinia elliptica TaxID=655355 RepID=A0A4R6HAN1_9BACT|nr:hypothetical protein DET52_101782 [Sunxiuqinia elliptica]TDO64968.1 hypothetical protein DET65_1341 [Sunxiuqinia elliptica]